MQLTYRLQTRDLSLVSKGGWIYDISETQSIVLSFSVGDDDSPGTAEYLDDGSKVFPMSTILNIENAAPTSSYSGSFTLPWDMALKGQGETCLKITFRFKFDEK